MKKFIRIILKFFLISIVVSIAIFLIKGRSLVETKEVFFRLKDFLNENLIFIIIGFLVWFFSSTGFIQSLMHKNIDIDLDWDAYSVFWIVAIPLIISIPKMENKLFLDNIDFLKPLLSYIVLRCYIYYLVAGFSFFFILTFLYVLLQRQKILSVGILINFVTSLSISCFISFFVLIFRMVRLDKLDDSFGNLLLIFIFYFAFEIGGIFNKEEIENETE